MGRSSQCAACAATVVVTSAKTQFRDGAMVLLCSACADGGPPQPVGGTEESDDYYASIEADGDEIEIEADEPPPGDTNVVYGTDDAAVSGSVDVDSGRVRQRDPTLPPVVIE